jgi:hypothetical protein
VNDSDNTTPGRVRGREMNSVGCEDLTQRVKVPIRRSTNILKADHSITLKKGLNVADNLEEARSDTARKGETARVDVVRNDRWKPEWKRDSVIRRDRGKERVHKRDLSRVVQNHCYTGSSPSAITEGVWLELLLLLPSLMLLSSLTAVPILLAVLVALSLAVLVLVLLAVLVLVGGLLVVVLEEEEDGV